MASEKAIRKIVRYYVFLISFAFGVVLLAPSNEPLVMRILVWLFFYLVVYRGLYKRYFMTEAERVSLKKPLPALYEDQQVTFVNVLQTIIIFFLLWGVTYATLKTYTSVLKPSENLFALLNGLIYSILYFAKVFDK
jgi:hypothetical protein